MLQVQYHPRDPAPTRLCADEGDAISGHHNSEPRKSIPPSANVVAISATKTPSGTYLDFSWPKGLTGIERTILSAKGDLQWLLGSYFAHPITITQISTTTKPPNPDPKSATPSHPIIQTRVVNETANARLVVVASSTVTITVPKAATLLFEKKNIGAVFASLGGTPLFELLQVGFGEEEIISTPSGYQVGVGMNGVVKHRLHDTLWRKYKLSTDGISCEIEEVFVDREMFRDEGWIDRPDASSFRRLP